MNTDEALHHFIAGFVSGEGSFFITARRAISRRKPTLQVVCGFSIKLRGDDRELIESIHTALGLDCTIHDRGNGAVMLIVRKLSDLTERVIPFFDRYPLRGHKREDYELWRKVVSMVECGEHLTPEGANTILEIKAQMNRD